MFTRSVEMIHLEELFSSGWFNHQLVTYWTDGQIPATVDMVNTTGTTV